MLTDLASKDEERRRHAARLVGEEYERKTHTLVSGPQWAEYQKSLDHTIFELTNSAVVHEQLGGLLLIQELTRHESEDNATKVANFANYLRQPITSSDPAVLNMATHCLGQLAHTEGGHAAVKPELERALQRLEAGSQHGNRLDSAVLVLCQLAEHAPTLTYVHLDHVFHHLWTAMRDTRVQTREGAAAVLRACLTLVAGRKSEARKRWYSRVYEEARQGLAERSGAFLETRPPETVHGALLTVAELLEARGVELSEAQLELLFEGAWACRDHRDRLVRRAVLEVPPRMASHCERSDKVAGLFHDKFLHGSVTLVRLVAGLRGRARTTTLPLHPSPVPTHAPACAPPQMLTALRSREYAELRPLIFRVIGDTALHTRSSLRGSTSRGGALTGQQHAHPPTILTAAPEHATVHDQDTHITVDGGGNCGGGDGGGRGGGSGGGSMMSSAAATFAAVSLLAHRATVSRVELKQDASARGRCAVALTGYLQIRSTLHAILRCGPRGI